jgi:hypothetical protein
MLIKTAPACQCSLRLLIPSGKGLAVRFTKRPQQVTCAAYLLVSRRWIVGVRDLRWVHGLSLRSPSYPPAPALPSHPPYPAHAKTCALPKLTHRPTDCCAIVNLGRALFQVAMARRRVRRSIRAKPRNGSSWRSQAVIGRADYPSLKQGRLSTSNAFPTPAGVLARAVIDDRTRKSKPELWSPDRRSRA